MHVLCGKEFILQYDDPDTCRRIDGFIDKQLQEPASFNKLALRSIVECVIFCGKQGISFRGHRDDATAILCMTRQIVVFYFSAKI